jgi:hypothetical protein
MSQFNLAKNAVNPDQVYFDLTVTNFQNTETRPQAFYYNEQRTLPFVNVPEDYYLSILRFTVETGTLPLFIPSIQPASQQGSAPYDVNLTLYSVTLSYIDPITSVEFIAQSYIEWIPQDTSAPVPPSLGSNGVQVNDNGYYNCYSYSFWIYLVWVAFQRAFGTGGQVPYGNANASLSAQLVTAGVVNPAQFAPFINWDSTSNTANITAEFPYCINQPSGSNPIRMYMNAPCFQLFNSFPARYIGYGGALASSGRNFAIELANIGGLNFTTITIPNSGTPAQTWDGYTLTQEYPTIENWSPILAIVFVSNTLPIQPSNVSTPVVYNNNQQIVLGGNNADTANIITDLVSDTGNYRPSLVYLPQAQYRYVTLYGNRPLYNLDLTIFYRTKTGQLIPFALNSGGSVTVKFAFIKKSSIA